jgi:hypothetical protein
MNMYAVICFNNEKISRILFDNETRRLWFRVFEWFQRYFEEDSSIS